MTPEERSRRASIAANARWSREPDRLGATEHLRRGLERKFEDEVDPERTLDPKVRAKLAANARKAFYMRIQERSRKVRARRNAS